MAGVDAHELLPCRLITAEAARYKAVIRIQGSFYSATASADTPGIRRARFAGRVRRKYSQVQGRRGHRVLFHDEKRGLIMISSIFPVCQRCLAFGWRGINPT